MVHLRYPGTFDWLILCTLQLMNIQIYILRTEDTRFQLEREQKAHSKLIFIVLKQLSVIGLIASFGHIVLTLNMSLRRNRNYQLYSLWFIQRSQGYPQDLLHTNHKLKIHRI